jgi:hypothetical protein
MCIDCKTFIKINRYFYWQRVCFCDIICSTKEKRMRLLLVGIICLFCGTAFAEDVSIANQTVKGANSVETAQQVPNRAYVDLMADSVAISKPKVNAPAGRALVWIEE